MRGSYLLTTVCLKEIYWKRWPWEERLYHGIEVTGKGWGVLWPLSLSHTHLFCSVFSCCFLMSAGSTNTLSSTSRSRQVCVIAFAIKVQYQHFLFLSPRPEWYQRGFGPSIYFSLCYWSNLPCRVTPVFWILRSTVYQSLCSSFVVFRGLLNDASLGVVFAKQIPDVKKN